MKIRGLKISTAIHRGFIALMTSVLTAMVMAAESYAQELDHMTIYIAGAESGGYDRTGMAIRDALIRENLVAEIDIVRSPGAGGLIGLAQFVESRRGDGSAIFLGARTTIGSANFNRSEVSLEDVESIVRLNGVVVVMAVPVDSKIRNLSDLIATLRTDPGLIKWVGGSAGSVDELLILEFAREIGVDRSRIDYRAVPGGGNNVAEHVLSGQSTVAVSSFEEVAEFEERGELRIIAVSSDNRLPTLSSPTFKEQGLDIVFSDWKGIFAAPGISLDSKQTLEEIFQKLSKSPSWANAMTEHGWQNVYLSGEEFESFVTSEINLIDELRHNNKAAKLPTERIVRIVGRQYRWLIWAVGIIGLLLASLLGQRWINRRRQDDLKTSLDMAEGELERKLAGATDHINAEFSNWKLTESENEIGWLLLKGLSFKEMAEARGTSERTVRQQARAIYAKSGLSSRSDVAAYFFEDFVFGQNA